MKKQWKLAWVLRSLEKGAIWIYRILGSGFREKNEKLRLQLGSGFGVEGLYLGFWVVHRQQRNRKEHGNLDTKRGIRFSIPVSYQNFKSRTSWV